MDEAIDIRRNDVVLRCPECLMERRMPRGFEVDFPEYAGGLHCKADRVKMVEV